MQMICGLPLYFLPSLSVPGTTRNPDLPFLFVPASPLLPAGVHSSGRLVAIPSLSRPYLVPILSKRNIAYARIPLLSFHSRPTRSARGLFIKTFQLTRFRRAFVFHFLRRDILFYVSLGFYL